MAEFKFDTKALVPNQVSSRHAGRPPGGLARRTCCFRKPRSLCSGGQTAEETDSGDFADFQG